MMICKIYLERKIKFQTNVKKFASISSEKMMKPNNEIVKSTVKVCSILIGTSARNLYKHVLFKLN